ncbi:MAG: pilus assembly PilX N-terminal domain-containing protein [bacterium]
MYKKRGQALLITIMLLSVALTVVLAMSYTSKTDVQLSKLEEENQKALAAAEAGIDALVNKASGESIAISSLSTGLKNFTGMATKTAVEEPEFSSPLLQPNGHYTLYLSDYLDFTNPYGGSVWLYYSSKSSCTDSSADALEITIIYGDNYPYTIKRFISDGGDRLALGSDKNDVYQKTGDFTIDGVNFKCKTVALAMEYPNPKIMVVRSIFNSTRIGFEGSSNLPTQGTTIKSEAKTPSGITKIVELFQSYPQIPLDFFTTSF